MCGHEYVDTCHGFSLWGTSFEVHSFSIDNDYIDCIKNPCLIFKHLICIFPILRELVVIMGQWTRDKVLVIDIKSNNDRLKYA